MEIAIMEEVVTIGAGAMPLIGTAAERTSEDRPDDGQSGEVFAGIFAALAASAIPPPPPLLAAAGGGPVRTEGHAAVAPFTKGRTETPVPSRTPTPDRTTASTGTPVLAGVPPRAGSHLSVGVPAGGGSTATAVAPPELPTSTTPVRAAGLPESPTSAAPVRAAVLPVEPVVRDMLDLPDEVRVRGAPDLPSSVPVPGARIEFPAVTGDGVQVSKESGQAQTAHAHSVPESPTAVAQREVPSASRVAPAASGASTSPEAATSPDAAPAAQTIGPKPQVSLPGSEPRVLNPDGAASGPMQVRPPQLERDGSGSAGTQGDPARPRLEEPGFVPSPDDPASGSDSEAATGDRETRPAAGGRTATGSAAAMETPDDAMPAGATPLGSGSAIRSVPPRGEPAPAPQATGAPSSTASGPERAAPVPRRMRLEIEVPALGAIRVDLRSRGAEVAAVATTEEITTGRALAAQAVPLQAALAAQGVHLAGFEVLAHWPGDRRGQQAAEPERGPPLPRVRSPAAAVQAGIVVGPGRIDCLV